MKALHAVPKKDNTPLMDSPDHPYPVPVEGNFYEADFLPAHDLDTMLRTLIARHDTLFSHLVNLDIACLWKAKGGASKGKPTLGKVQVATGLVGFFSEANFVIWLAADHLRAGHATAKVVEACLFHEMCHIGSDGQDGKAMIVGHDIEAFTEEIKQFGWWETDLQKFAQTMRQLNFFEEESK